MQAIPFLEGYDDLGDDEIAIACASHHAEPAQLAAVRKVLARAGARSTTSRTACRKGGRKGSSATTAPGKHAGMLAACRAHGWPLHPYRSIEHPLQKRSPQLVGGARSAVDGCGVPTFARRSRGVRGVPARHRRGSARDAARPELVGGAGAADTELMRARRAGSRRAAPKGSSARPHGRRGVALRAEDGAFRAHRPGVWRIVFELDAVPPEVRGPNSRGGLVGLPSKGAA